MKNAGYFCLSKDAVRWLADLYGTPALVLSTAQVERNYMYLREHLPRVKIHYAMKANPDKHIIQMVADLGGNFDVASAGEIAELSAMGISGERMLYANPFKVSSGLDTCVDAGVDKFTLDSESEIDKLARRLPGANVLLRLRLDNPDALVDLNKKFGAPPERIPLLMDLAAAAGLNVLGLCFHVGSQTVSAEPYLRALKKSRELFDQAAARGYELKVLDIGGGYPVRSMMDDIDIVPILSQINAALDELFPDTELWSEPGRFICATAVNMIAKVIGVTERNGQPWYFLDEGVYGTFSGVLFDHWDYEFISFKTGFPVSSTFAGPSCDSLDVICCDRLTVPLSMDDLLLVPSCGAYSSASATTFNGFAKAAAVVWEEVAEGCSLAAAM